MSLLWDICCVFFPLPIAPERVLLSPISRKGKLKRKKLWEVDKATTMNQLWIQLNIIPNISISQRKREKKEASNWSSSCLQRVDNGEFCLSPIPKDSSSMPPTDVPEVTASYSLCVRSSKLRVGRCHKWVMPCAPQPSWRSGELPP